MTTPQPSGYGRGAALTTQEERTWALASHIGCVVGAWIAMAFLVPLVIMLIKPKGSGFVRQHAVESLNFQLSMLIYLAVGTLLVIFTFGIAAIVVVPLGIVVGVLWLVFIVVATVKASNGESYRYPLTIRLVR